MLEEFKEIAMVVIFLISVGSGFYPLLKREKARAGGGFPLGEAFAAGVFLALSLTLMLPGGRVCGYAHRGCAYGACALRARRLGGS